METASDDVALDFSGLFESSATQSQGSYLDRTLQRIVGLVAFTPEERSAQERLLERCRALQSSTLSEEDARAAVDAETEALCQRLGEGESEQRRGAYISYLAICKLSGIEPRQQSFEAMVDETERLKESYIAREAAKVAPDRTDVVEAQRDSVAYMDAYSMKETSELANTGPISHRPVHTAGRRGQRTRRKKQPQLVFD